MATLLQDTAWGILTLATTITAWRIQPALGADTAWQIEAMLNSSTAWAVTGGIRQRVAWKMIENENDIPGINSHTVTVTIAGTVVEPNSISLSADTDSLSWSAQLALPDEVAFNLCTTGTEVSISIDGMTWALKIKHRDKSRSYPAEQWSAVAVSAFALNADDPVSLILESETLVSEVAATIAGMNVLWLIDNWRLPTGLKISEASSRRDVLRSLADAAGAVVSSRPDGTLVVLPGTPTDAAIATSRAQWFVADTININRDVLPRNTYKRVLCGSEGLYLPREISLQVTATDDEARTVKIGVWIAPDPIEPTVTNAGPSTITVHKNHYVSEEVTEKVTFINGLGSVARPIDLYRSADWGAHENLGAVSVIGETQLLAAAGGDSIAEVIYTTRYYEYVITDSDTGDISTVFCAAVDPIRADIMADCQRGSGDLSPEVLTSHFCTELAPAKERGRVYLDLHSGDLATIDIDKIWDGGELPDLGDVVEFDGVLTRLTALSVAYSFPAVTLSATLEEVG